MLAHLIFGRTTLCVVLLVVTVVVTLLAIPTGTVGSRAALMAAPDGQLNETGERNRQ